MLSVNVILSNGTFSVNAAPVSCCEISAGNHLFELGKGSCRVEGKAQADKEAATQDGVPQDTTFRNTHGTWGKTKHGEICRSFYSNIEERLKMKIHVTPEFSAIVSGHGKTKSYLHVINIIIIIIIMKYAAY